MKLILESIGNLKNRVLEGIALTPTVSANGNIYAAEELNKVHNLQIPLYTNWEHTQERIGDVVFTLKKEKNIIEYRATITDDKRAAEIQEGVHKVSIEADVQEAIPSCTKTRCYNLLEGITLKGIAVTSKPSVGSTTMKIVESYQDWKAIHGVCENCTHESEDPIIQEIEKRLEILENTLFCPDCGEVKKKFIQ